MATTYERFKALCYPGAAEMAHTTNPLLAARVVVAIEGDDRFRVASTGRSYETQKAKYDPWNARGRTPPPPAIANPDYVRKDGTKGSRHMVQSGTGVTWRTAIGEPYRIDGFSNAVDIVPHAAGANKAKWYKDLERICADVGLMLNVGAYGHGADGLHTRRSSAFEPWHFQLNQSKDFDDVLTLLTYHDVLLTGMHPDVVPPDAEALEKVSAINRYMGYPPEQYNEQTFAAIASISQHLALLGNAA